MLIEKTAAGEIEWREVTAGLGFSQAFSSTEPPDILVSVAYSGDSASLAFEGDEALVSPGPEAAMCDLLRSIACDLSATGEAKRAAALRELEVALRE